MKQSQISNLNTKVKINYIKKDSNASCFSPTKGPANCSVILYKINYMVRHAYIPRSEVHETKVEQPFQKDNISSNIEIGFAFY